MKSIAKRVGMVIFAALLLAAGLATAGLRPASGSQQDTPEHRVVICHDVEGAGNTGNGYNLIEVDKDSIASNPNGHDTHEGDLIPPFPAGFTVGPPPKQWNAYPGKGDFSLIATDCAEPPGTTTTTTTTTTTETTTTEPPDDPPETTTTTETTPPPRCPPGMVPTEGKDGEPGNDECEFPPTETQPPVTTTTTPTPPTTTTDQPTETAPTEPIPTTAEPPAVKPPTASPPKAKPPKKKQAKPKPPPLCPVAKPTTGPCSVQGSG